MAFHQFPHLVKLLALLLPICILSACLKPSNQIQLRGNSANLNQQYAAFRASQVSNIHYAFNIDITRRDTFSGTAHIQFDLKPQNVSPVTLDFSQGKIINLSINGKQFSHHYEKWFITLPPHLLNTGKNVVTVEYQRGYANDGQGLHQYHDEKSSNYYLFTQFEVYAANRFAPIFDQPDMKATYSMTVAAPNNWHVISATRETAIKDLGNGNAQWHFPETQTIPSYIFSLHAGPFEVWEDQYKNIPLRLFARKEMAEFIHIDDWFPTTKHAFSYLEQYFNYPYPFGKYDQIIVPDFNFGAMENVGAVTFSERFVSRGKKTERQRYWQGNVIAHELIHMWFGNVVTMKWWNGLWLNESFATFLAYQTIADNPKFKDAWTYFANLKGWAYYEDQLVTTHPIDVPVHDTGEAMNVLDGISYAKGASVLRQLSTHVGEQSFQRAISSYIQKYQYENTKLEDFAGAVASASDKNIHNWVQQWLLSPGLNTITTDHVCENGLIQELNVLQSAPAKWPTLRDQTIQLGLYTEQNQRMLLSHTLAHTYSGKKSSVPLEGDIPCPDFIYPNQGDWAYLKAQYNTQARQILERTVGQFQESNMRLSLWSSMWSLVHDAKIPFTEYLSFLDKNISAENNDAVLAHILVKEELAFNLVEAMNLGEPGQSILQKIENILWRELELSAPKSNRQIAFLKTAISVTHSEQGLHRLTQLLNREQNINGIQLDADLRWQMIIQLHRYNHPKAEKILTREQASDDSERARLAVLSASAILPGSNRKNQYLTQLMQLKSNMKLEDVRAISKNLFPGKQQSHRFEFAEEIINSLEPLSNNKDAMFFSVFAKNMLPVNCTDESVDLLARALAAGSNYNPTLIKELKIQHQNDQRCMAQKKLLLHSQTHIRSITKATAGTISGA